MQKSPVMKTLLIGVAIWAGTLGLAGAQTAETAAPPPVIRFGGVMTDAAGQPVTGLVSAIFALYAAPAGGVPLWVDIQAVQTDAAGRYVVLLGAATELWVDLFTTGEALWLGVQPEGQAEQPRVRFISVPYALKASDADTLGGRPLSEFVLLSGENGDPADSLTSASSDDLVSTSGDTFPDLTVNGPAVFNGLSTFNSSSLFSGPAGFLSLVGIGTAFPTAQLDIATTVNQTWAAQIANAGTTGAHGLYLNIGDSSTGVPFRVDKGGSALFQVSNDGKVGIGTTSPTAKLHVVGEVTVDGNVAAANLGVTGNLGVGTASPTATLDITTAVNSSWAAQIFNDGTTGAHGLYLNIGNGSTGVPLRVDKGGSALLQVSNNGNVGIGTVSPAAKLHVAGDVTVDGNIAAKYQDVAEWVEAVGTPTPGTVVVADPTGRNRVRVAEAEYDTTVLGAVSFQPGVVLGEPGPNRVLVAQSGRVKVKVDARYGAIATGDLLSTSPTQGHAMRSDPLHLGEISLHRPGTVLGKALEPLDTGRGEILVLLTLQ